MPLSIKERLQQAAATSKELQVATGLNQSAVSRKLRAMEESIIRLPHGRSPRYALTCNAFGGNDRLPIYMVDSHGNNTPIAYLRPLAHGGFFVEPQIGMPALLLGENGDGVYGDLPYFLDDLRPQGFLGRQIAAELASQTDDFPTDPRHWNAGHVGRYLISNGDDLPGNFKFGQYAHLRIRQKPTAIAEADYPALADSVMSGTIPGSPAGGEQPKFTTFSSDHSSHVIVKFSPRGDGAIARRWRDILITEYHATKAIHTQGFPAAETQLIERDGRLFLESQRFDRIGEFGRMSIISLQSVDAEFVGLGGSWHQVMSRLYKNKLVSREHRYDATILGYFGRLINNTDMHLGNLSLAIEGGVFRILPIYDMCSMGFAPKGGEVQPYSFTTPNLQEICNNGAIAVAIDMAYGFWQCLAADEQISDEFRAFLAQNNPADQMMRS